MSASSGKGAVPAYSLLVCAKVPARSVSQKLTPTTVLLDTGASVLLMPLWQVKALNIDVKPKTDLIIRGADGQPLVVEGTGEVWVRDPMATYWKKVKIVITRDGSWTLISPRDQKRLLLLQPDYPWFLGTGRYRRSNARNTQKMEIPQTRACQDRIPRTQIGKRRTL